MDPFHRAEIFDPAHAAPATAVPTRYSAVPEMYCILSNYVDAAEICLSREPLSLSALDRTRRPRLAAEDCTALLRYSEQDFATLQASAVPFFGEQLERGDLSFEVWPLPRIPITLTLWQGDEEIPDGGTLLLDSSAPHYLPGLLGELARLTVWRLRNILNPEVKWGYHHLAARTS